MKAKRQKLPAAVDELLSEDTPRRETEVLWAALRRALPMLAVPLYFLVTAVLSFAGLLYVVEYLIGGNKDFDNVFVSAWFVLVTMTSVG